LATRSIVPGAFNTVRVAIALPKGRSATQPRLAELLAEAKRAGVAQKAIEQAGLRPACGSRRIDDFRLARSCRLAAAAEHTTSDLSPLVNAERTVPAKQAPPHSRRPWIVVIPSAGCRSAALDFGVRPRSPGAIAASLPAGPDRDLDGDAVERDVGFELFLEIIRTVIV